MGRRRWVKAGGMLILAAGGAALALWSAWSPQRPAAMNARELAAIALPQRLRNPAEHDAARARVGSPYLLEITAGDGALIYYGASHASDRERSQVADITARWRAFGPTIALGEGRASGYFIGPLLGRFGPLPEPRLVHQLAAEDEIAVHSLEPRYQDEVALLLETWKPEQVAMYFTLRVYWSEAGGTPDESLAEHLRRKRTNVEGLEHALPSIADMDRVWRRDFPQAPDWRGLTVGPEGTYLADIGDASRCIRGEHMARLLIDLVRRGERVFAVVGSGHVIRQEWMLREALGAEAAPDQPPPTGQ